jgi:hypothetical protein
MLPEDPEFRERRRLKADPAWVLEPVSHAMRSPLFRRDNGSGAAEPRSSMA